MAERYIYSAVTHSLRSRYRGVVTLGWPGESSSGDGRMKKLIAVVAGLISAILVGGANYGW